MKAPTPAAAVNASRPSIETLRQLLGPDAALIPVEKGEKRPTLSNWQTLTCTWSADPANEARLQTGNVGVNLGAPSGGLISIDFDDDRLAEEMAALNPVLTKTLTTRRSRGCNFWIRALYPWPAYAELKDDGDNPVGEWRADGHQTVIAGEAEGVPYTITREAPVQIVDFHALRWPARIRQLPADPARQIVEAERGELISVLPKKQRDGTVREEIRLNTVPLAHLVARRSRIFHEAETGFFWMYQPDLGAWQRVTKNRIKGEAEAALHQLAETEAPELFGQRTNHQLGQVAALVEMADERRGDPFADRPHKGRVIHAANAMVLVESDKVRELRHAPEFLSRHPSAIPHIPGSRCDRFLSELVRPMFSGPDLDLVQRYFGACLLHDNSAQQLLLIRGPGDAGKGTLVRILEQVIGANNVTELRTRQLGKNRFELNQCAPYSLLLGQEAGAEFLSGENVGILKAMVGSDSLKCEAKGLNATFTRRGNWNVIITTNHRLRVRLHGDIGAWRRRLLIVEAQGRGGRTSVIPNFEAVLLREEGPGILAWLIEGAVRHVAELETAGRFELNAEQQERVESLLAESESARHFAEDCIEKSHGEQLTVQDALVAYAEYADAKGWELGPDRSRSAEIQQAVLDVHRVAQSHDIKKSEDSRACRGWRNLRLRPADTTGEAFP